MCVITRLSKHFMIIDVCYRLVVIVAVFLGSRNDGDQFETCRNYKLGQVEFENNFEYACQLFCACSELSDVDRLASLLSFSPVTAASSLACLCLCQHVY